MPRRTRQRFGRYETLFRFATGGMAEVYVARAIGAAGFERLVALKRILPDMNDDERVVAMFMDEGRLAANITSSHVVSTLDLGRADDGSLYIVMDLVIGAPLSRLMAHAAQASADDPRPAVAVEIIRQAARGLHDAHEATTPTGEPLNLVHRDVSPQNILVGADGRVQITDFGIARAEHRKSRTSTGQFKGKITYFSPEQVKNLPLDRRCDIFALGIVAWEVLTRRRLFSAENPLAILDQVMNMPITPPHELRPEVPEPISDIVMKALARDRDERWQTAAELEDALHEAAKECLPPCSRADLSVFVSTYGGEMLERIQAKIKRALERADEEVDELDTGDLTPAPVRRKGFGWPLKAGLVGLVAAGGVAAAVALRLGESESRAPSASAPVASASPAPAPAASPPAPVEPAPEPAPPEAQPSEPAAAPAPRARRSARRGRRGERRASPVEEIAAAPAAPEREAPPPVEATEPEPRLGTNRAPILR